MATAFPPQYFAFLRSLSFGLRATEALSNGTLDGERKCHRLFKAIPGNILCRFGEYSENGSCHLPIDVIVQALDIAMGLEYLHGSKPSIIHGDLKGVGLTCIQACCLLISNLLSGQCSHHTLKKSLPG